MYKLSDRTVTSNSPYAFLACCGKTLPFLVQTLVTRLGCIVDKIIILTIKSGYVKERKRQKEAPQGLGLSTTW